MGASPRGAAVKAIWNGATLAHSEDTLVVENNHYFAPESVGERYFRDSDTHTICSWKGVASYSVTIDP